MKTTVACDVKIWQLAAPAYSAVMSMLELTWCVQLLFTTKSPEKGNWYPWNFVDKLQDSEAIHRFTVACFLFHILWLTSSLILLYHIKAPKRWITLFWTSTTILVTIWSIATSIYFMVRLNDVRTSPIIKKRTMFNSYVALLLIFSGGFMFWIFNIALLVLLGRKWMGSCVLCPETEETRGFYKKLKEGVVIRDFSDSNGSIQMDDVIFDARELRNKKIFHINSENGRNIP